MMVLSQTDDMTSEKADPALIVVPPIEQFQDKYSFATSKYAATATGNYKQHIVIVAPIPAKRDIRMDDKVLGAHGYEAKWFDIAGTEWSCGYTEVKPGSHPHTLRHYLGTADGAVAFGAILYGAGNKESYAFPVGMKTSRLNTVCQKCKNIPCDPADNDCDGRVNEELCDGIDNDNDGLIDEDCCGGPPIKSPTPAATKAPRAKKITPNQCSVLTTKQICFADKGNLKCDNGKKIKILQAHFGRMGYADDSSCGGNPTNSNGESANCGYYDMYSTVAPRCDKANSCDLKVDSLLAGVCDGNGGCQKCAKYLDISYTCGESNDNCMVLSTVTYTALNNGQFSASSYMKTGGSESHMTCKGGGGMGSCQAMKAPDDSDLCNPKWAIFASDNTHAWCPENCDKENSFLQIDLGNVYDITGVAVQGCRRFPKWVTKFSLGFSKDVSDSNTFQMYEDQRGDEVMFDANTDSHTVKYCSAKFKARFVRVYVKGFHSHPCMHFEVMRCNKVY